MVEFDIRINAKERVAYIPKEICEALGLDLRLVGNRCSAIIYPRNASLADIIRSLKILLADFEHGLDMEKGQEAKVVE